MNDTTEAPTAPPPEIEAVNQIRAALRLPPDTPPAQVVASVQRVVPPAGHWLTGLQRYSIEREGSTPIVVCMRTMTGKEARTFRADHHAFIVRASKARPLAVAYDAARAAFDAAIRKPEGTVTEPGVVVVDDEQIAQLADAVAKRADLVLDLDGDRAALHLAAVSLLVERVEGVPELIDWPKEPEARADKLVGLGEAVLARMYDYAAACLAGVAPEARGN